MKPSGEVSFIGGGQSVEVTLLSFTNQDAFGFLFFNNKINTIKFTIISRINSKLLNRLRVFASVGTKRTSVI